MFNKCVYGFNPTWADDGDDTTLPAPTVEYRKVDLIGDFYRERNRPLTRWQRFVRFVFGRK